MRILFRKKQTQLVTNIQSRVNVIYEPYDVNRNDNFENAEYCKAENTNLAEKDNISNPQPSVVNHNLSTQSLTVHSNEQHKLMNVIKIDNEINQSHSFSNESSPYENENLSDCPNDESLLDTTNCSSLQKSKIPRSDSPKIVENIDKTISKKNGLIKEASRNINSKLPSFSIINDHQNKLLRRIKTERYNNGIEFNNTVEKRCHLLSTERLKAAKDEVDEAIKSRKIFSVLGPYNRIRKALRTRGWIEKFDVNIGSFGQLTQGTNKSMRLINNTKNAQNSFLNDTTTLEDSEDGDSDDDMTAVANEEKQRIQPWEEENGYYGMLSRMVRSELPRFIWSLRKSQVDFNNLHKDQMINHHSGAPFTTKVGLCRQLRQIRWFADCNADYFFPRCFIISEDEERQSFINDFRLTACISIVKMIAKLIPDIKKPDPVVNQFNSKTNCDRKNVDETVENNNSNDSVFVETENFSLTDSTTDTTLSLLDTKISSKKLWNINFVPNDLSENFQIPDEIIEFSIFQCQNFLKMKFHEDLDKSNKQSIPSEYPWDKFLSWYYRIIKMPQLLKTTRYFASDCQYLCKLLKKYCPQFEMDGVRNVWIVKPGAKSRGRGIVCLDRLDDILKIVQGSVFLAEARYVIQKYIEKPLLIHKTKFDIRQWFLVTDWAPLTVWWYQDCYLRFCSHEFTLDDFSESIHLCNNCIQHKYKNGLRSSKLPDENMWTWEQFQNWLTEQGQPNLWTEKIQPSMKSAVLNALLSSQESIEPRKNCFGLYGADFILTADDYRLWLIEINSSPCMSPSTSVTAVYTANVLEDTLKVVLDRKYNRTSDTGRFELFYRQPFHNPSNMYTGMELYVIGSKIHRPQLENTNILRCFNKATLEFNGQSLSTSEVNRMSTVVKDKQNITSISQSQANLQTQKQIQPSNLCHGYVNTPEIVKGITCSPTNRTARSKSCKSENRLKINNGLTVFKSMTNIERLAGTESNVTLIKYYDENIDHCDNNRLKASYVEHHKKAPTREIKPSKNSPVPSNMKDLSTVNLNQSTFRLLNKGELIQSTRYEACHHHTNLQPSHINSKNKNLQSSILLLPKINKTRNSETCIKLISVSLNNSKSLNKTKRLTVNFEHERDTVNVDKKSVTDSANSISIQELSKEQQHREHILPNKHKQRTNRLSKRSNLPTIVKITPFSTYRSRIHQPTLSTYHQLNTNPILHKIPTYIKHSDKIKLNIIQFTDKNRHLEHSHHSNFNSNSLHKQLRKKCIILHRMKKLKNSPVVQRNSSITQPQSKFFKVLIMNQRLPNSTMKDNSSMELNNRSVCQKLEGNYQYNSYSNGDCNFESDKNNAIDGDGNNHDEALETKSTLKQNSCDSGFDDERKITLIKALPLDDFSTTITNRNNTFSKNILPYSVTHSSRMFINHHQTDDTVSHRFNNKFNLRFLSRSTYVTSITLLNVPAIKYAIQDKITTCQRNPNLPAIKNSQFSMNTNGLLEEQINFSTNYSVLSSLSHRLVSYSDSSVRIMNNLSPSPLIIVTCKLNRMKKKVPWKN
ncbi:hypothetical protein MN116_006200 [Schistosoma mekongi]|uniref:ATP-grasp domain-containing protein n=1 Tax=Schistosoma mekongi TaxID=38744 RepID=A0AAE1ZBI7_SCHME|nr:hypothetical protein MN116_006200 [Schistosoma mekongi]